MDRPKANPHRGIGDEHLVIHFLILILIYFYFYFYFRKKEEDEEVEAEEDHSDDGLLFRPALPTTSSKRTPAAAKELGAKTGRFLETVGEVKGIAIGQIDGDAFDRLVGSE